MDGQLLQLEHIWSSLWVVWCLTSIPHYTSEGLLLPYISVESVSVKPAHPTVGTARWRKRRWQMALQIIFRSRLKLSWCHTSLVHRAYS